MSANQISNDGSLRGFPMYVYADGSTALQFKNLCGVLKNQLYMSNTTVTSIALSTSNSYPVINGTFQLLVGEKHQFSVLPIRVPTLLGCCAVKASTYHMTSIATCRQVPTTDSR